MRKTSALAVVCLLALGVDVGAGPDGTGAAKAAQRAEAQYTTVVAYLDRAGLLRFVSSDVAPHGAGDSFHVTLRLAADEASKASVLRILRDPRMFDSGPLGPGHVKEVGAATRADALDFRSVGGTFGPGSLEVMINRVSFQGYADIDRFNLYGGLAPAFAHVFFELLPHEVAGLFKASAAR